MTQDGKNLMKISSSAFRSNRASLTKKVLQRKIHGHQREIYTDYIIPITKSISRTCRGTSGKAIIHNI